MAVIYTVIGIAWEETTFDKAYVRKDMAEMRADQLNAEQDIEYYWYTTKEMELIK